jgi:hypothetical protein
VYADVRSVDRELRIFVLKRLSDSRHAAAISAARSQVAERLAEVNEEITRREALQRALSERLGSRQITLDPTGTGRARWTMRWEPVINAFAITFGDRWPGAETY